jgi:hypothetical protein
MRCCVVGASNAAAAPTQQPKPINTNASTRTREKLIQLISSLPSECRASSFVGTCSCCLSAKLLSAINSAHLLFTIPDNEPDSLEILKYFDFAENLQDKLWLQLPYGNFHKG